jgi:hypothetical protein
MPVKPFTASPTRRPSFSLHYQRAGKPLAHVVPDRVWPGMYRARYADGSLSDMVNLTRAKDAAVAVCASKLGIHNRSRLRGETHGGMTEPRPPVAPFDAAAPDPIHATGELVEVQPWERPA